MVRHAAHDEEAKAAPSCLGRCYSCSTTQIKGKLEWALPCCLSGLSQVIPARTSWAQRLIKTLSKFVCLGVCVLLPSSNTLKCSNSPSSPSQTVPTQRYTQSYLCTHKLHMLLWTKYIHSPNSRLNMFACQVTLLLLRSQLWQNTFI